VASWRASILVMKSVQFTQISGLARVPSALPSGQMSGSIKESDRILRVQEHVVGVVHDAAQERAQGVLMTLHPFHHRMSLIRRGRRLALLCGGGTGEEE